MGKDVIIACDFSSAEETLSFLDRFTGRKPFVKIGMELFYSGLPVVCASPLHGPAFDIANQNKAEPDSYRKAVFLAADIVAHRKEQ